MTTTTTTNNNVEVLIERNVMEDGFKFLHYTVNSFEAALYNAWYALPEESMIESEEEFDGCKYTTFKIFDSNSSAAVMIENEGWGVSISFYNEKGWIEEMLWEIKK